MHKIKNWLIPGILIIAAGFGIFYLWPNNVKPPTLQQSGIRPPIPTPVEPLEKADGLRVKNRYGEFFFDRRPDGWYMTAPFAAKANDKLISGLLRKMQTFQFGLVVSSSSETHARDKVSGKQAIEVEILHQKRTLWHFYLGKSSEYTLFRAENSNDVWQIQGAMRQSFVRDATAWIRPEIVGKSEKDVAQLAFFRPDGSEFARFAFEGEKREVKALSVPPGLAWHPSRVERSLKRLLNLRIAFAEPDAAKIGSDLEGTAELVFLDGSALRLSIYAGKEERVPVRVEERVPPSGNFEKLAYVPLVQLFSLRDLLLIDPMDLADPLVLKIDESAVEAMRGKCKNFSWDFVRDASGAFVVKSSTSAFALARSRLDEFFGFLASGKLEASDVVEPLKVPAEFMPDANSDFLELDIRQEKGKKPQTVRISWGKPTPADNTGVWYHYTKATGKDDRVYKVMDKLIVAICRSRDDWMLQPKDPENTPVPGQ